MSARKPHVKVSQDELLATITEVTEERKLDGLVAQGKLARSVVNRHVYWLAGEVAA